MPCKQPLNRVYQRNRHLRDHCRCVILALVLIVSLSGCGDKECENDRLALQEEVSTKDSNIRALRAALQEANDNISNANFAIAIARGEAGTSYSSMRDALEMLEDIEEVDEP